MTSLIKNKCFIGSLLAPLLALLIFAMQWGNTQGTEFWSTLDYYTFTLFFWTILAMPAMLWDARKIQAVVVTLLCLWLEAQVLYGRQFYTAIPPSGYGEALTVVNGFGSAVLALLAWKDLLYLIPIALAWVCCKGYTHKPTRLQRNIYLALMCIGWICSWGRIWYCGGLEDVMRKTPYKLSAQRVAKYTPFAILWNDMLLKFSPLDEVSRQQITDWWKTHARLFGTDTYPAENPPQKVILVMVESLESWLVDLDVEGEPVMPTLRAMAHDSTSMYAPNVVCQVLGGHSSDAQILDLGGMLPLYTGTWALEKHSSLKYALPLAFTEAHREASTAYFATDAGRNWNQWGYAPSMGFKTTFFREDYPSDIEARMCDNRLDDHALSTFTGHYLNTTDGYGADDAFFVQQVTISLHSMFVLPKGVPPQLTLNGSYDDTMRGYLQCARYTDRGLKILLDSLAKRPDFNDITVIVTGDHTGLNYRRTEIRERHPWVTPEPTVPFVVYHSPIQGRFDKYIGQVDLYPTLLDLLGLNEYKWRGMGISLFNPKHPGIGYNLIAGPFGNSEVPYEVLQHLKSGYNVAHNTLYYDLMDKKE